jgi:hypothetical protein
MRRSSQNRNGRPESGVAKSRWYRHLGNFPAARRRSSLKAGEPDGRAGPAVHPKSAVPEATSCCRTARTSHGGHAAGVHRALRPGGRKARRSRGRSANSQAQAGKPLALNLNPFLWQFCANAPSTVVRGAGTVPPSRPGWIPCHRVHSGWESAGGWE